MDFKENPLFFAMFSGKNKVLKHTKMVGIWRKKKRVAERKG